MWDEWDKGAADYDIIRALSFHVLFPFALMLSRITSGRVRKGAAFFIGARFEESRIRMEKGIGSGIRDQGMGLFHLQSFASTVVEILHVAIREVPLVEIG